MFEEEERGKKWYEYYELWVVIVGVLFVLIFRGRLGVTQIDTAVFYTFVGSLLLFLGMTAEKGFKLASPKFVSNPIHDTTDGTFETVGNYALIKLGVIDAAGIHETITHSRTAIVPLTAINPCGRNIATPIRLEAVTFDELPLEIQAAIKQGNYKAPYYIGYATPQQCLKDPDIVRLKEEIKQQNLLISTLEKNLRKFGLDIETFIADISRISERARGGTWEKIISALKPGEEK